MMRGNGDTLGVIPAWKPLLAVTAPTVAYAAFYRSAPPAVMVHGVIASYLLQLYDRCLTPRGETVDVMPTTHLHRRGL
jgi:hypothetical protein